MIDIIYYIVLLSTLFLFILSMVIYKKLNIVKLLIILVVYSIVIVWEFFPEIIENYSFTYIEEVYNTLIIFTLIIMSITFRRKIQVTKNLTDYDFFELEKELDRIKDVSDLLRKRFIYSIDLLNEGLIFYENDYSGLYITDQVKTLVNTNKNQLSMDEFLDLVHLDDQKQYLINLKKLNEKVPSYEMKYRIQAGENYAWVIEKRRMFKHDKSQHIISTFKPVNLKLFPDTMIEELDSLPYEDDLTKTLSLLRKEKQTFYLVMLHLTNIPDINKRFGRDVGNLMIAEYVKNMRYHFAREKNTLFRMTGIQFALIIKDDLKYQNLYRALSSGGDLINLKLSIGGIQQIIYPNIGVVKSDPWSKVNINDLISLSQKALEEAISDNKNNYSIFGGA
ncbi:diguanylate cyclase [Mycoplasmatota bacterium]|nr:diguanylate cyclase [Mycoplasmatota bacterium]